MKSATGLETLVAQRIQENMNLQQVLLADTAFQQAVSETGAALANALRERHKVLFFGNGGSAADAQHLAAELAGRFQFERPALAGLALTVNASSLTAIGNDYAFDQIFARQVESVGLPGDAAIGITTSGRSRNVIYAFEAARNRGLLTVALTGRHSDTLRPLADYCLCIPSDNTARIQEAHILIGHILCEIIERELFDKSNCFHPFEPKGMLSADL
jgi:D-sedoheptulose 7-phosphate isomerase